MHKEVGIIYPRLRVFPQRTSCLREKKRHFASVTRKPFSILMKPFSCNIFVLAENEKNFSISGHTLKQFFKEFFETQTASSSYSAANAFFHAPAGPGTSARQPNRRSRRKVRLQVRVATQSPSGREGACQQRNGLGKPQNPAGNNDWREVKFLVGIKQQWTSEKEDENE